MALLPRFLRVLVATAVLGTGLVTADLVHAPATPAAADSATGIPVLGGARLTARQLANWFRSTGRTAKIPVSIDTLADYYVVEGFIHGVRGDVAFAQSVVETGYFGFAGSIVKPENYNYAGMGACDSCSSGRQFPGPRSGIRAQVQHLRNFSDPLSLTVNLGKSPSKYWYGRRSDGTFDQALANRNFDTFFAKGDAPTWNQMGGPGKWASAPNYGAAVIGVYNQILTWNGLPGSCPPDRLAFGGAEATQCPVAIRHPGRAVAAATPGRYVLNGNGSVTAIGGAPGFGHPSFNLDIARDIAVMPDGRGYVVLDGYGGLHKYGSAKTGAMASLTGPYFGFDIARSLAIRPDGAGLYVLDGYGGIHVSGTAKVPAGNFQYWSGWDIARALSVTLNGNGLVVLDGFGGVWKGGTVKGLGNDYFGFDIARDIVVMPAGDGYAVLDGFGGVHIRGTAPASSNPGYAAYDRWRGFYVRNGDYAIVRNDGVVAIT